MGRDVGEVVTVEADGAVRCDLGGGDVVTAEPFGPAGDDSPPLPGDSAALTRSPGAGRRQVSGYSDGTERKAAGGERRLYSRDADGNPVAEVWLKADGSVEATSLSGNGSMSMDPSGVVSASGDVVANAGSAGQIKLTTLRVPSPFGPLGPPIPEPD